MTGDVLHRLQGANANASAKCEMEDVRCLEVHIMMFIEVINTERENSHQI